MKTHFAIVTAALMFSSGFALAQQQQYDSLGSPTPAVQPNASPTAPQPNVPIPNPDLNKRTTGTNGEKSLTTGSGTGSGNAAGASTGVDAPNNNGGSTPSGLTDD
jgi:hypothetical protein